MSQQNSLAGRVSSPFTSVKNWVMNNGFVRFMRRVMDEMSKDDGTNMAAAVTFFAFLSLFPLLLGLIGLLGLFLPSKSVQDQIFSFLQQNLPGAKDAIETNINDVIKLRGTLGIIGILGLLWSGSGIMASVGHAINRAWNINTELPFYLKKPRDVGLTIGLGILFFLSLGASSAFAAVPVGSVPIIGSFIGQVLLFVVAFGLSFLMFIILFKIMPNTQTYMRHVWPGALFTAVLFEVGRTFFLYYIVHFGNYSAVYGTIGSVIAVLLWIYYSAILIILGAEFTSEYSRLRRGVGKGAHSHTTAKPAGAP